MNNEELKNLLYIKQLLYANCSKYVGGYDCLPSSELEHINETVIELICEMRGAPVTARYKGEIDIHQNFKKINTDYTKEHCNDIFYILEICNEFATGDNEMRDVMFHPNGKTGCITVDDDYIFGIRCDHLVWIEGYSEIFGNGYMLIGNHKGMTAINFVSSIGEVANEEVHFLFE